MDYRAFTEIMNGIRFVSLLDVIKFILYWVLFPSCVFGACTFPNDLRGNWISSDKGTLNFTATTVYGYKVNNVFGRAFAFVFNCKKKQGDIFLLKADDWHGVAPQLCLEFYKMTPNKYTYQIANNYDSQSKDRLNFNGTGTIGTACDRRKPFQRTTSNILVKEESTEDGTTTVMCPSSLQQIFSDGGLGGVTCTDNLLNVCQDRSHMTFIRGSSCSSMPTPTGGNSFVCLHQIFETTSGLTHLYIWANSSVAVSNPISCMVFKATDKSLHGKIYPGSCDHNPSGTQGSTGLSMSYRNTTKSCQDKEEITPSIIGLVAGAAGGVIFLGLVIAAIVYIIKKKKCRCLTGRRKVGHSKNMLNSSQERMSVSSLSKDENLNLFVAKEPNKIGLVIPDLHPPPYVELLYQVETKKMSNKHVFDKNTVFLSDLSLRSK